VNRFIVFALVTFLLAGPTIANPNVAEVAAAWRSRLASELPLGSKRAAVLAWAERNHIQLGEGAEPRQVIVPIGYIKETPSTSSLSVSSSASCDGWGISAALEFNSADELVKRDVRTLGNCL